MLKYLGQIFTSDSCVSFGRYATALTITVACGNLTWLVHKNHALPDGAQLVALGVFMTSPYAINKAASTFYSRPEPPTQ